jgi:pimeloyl-ACP methyl ester carboxylesterase
MAFFLKTRSLKLAYETREGKKPVLLCLHGNSSHRNLWKPLLEYFPDRAAAALDLRGHGLSEWVRPPAYATSDYAKDIKALVNGLDLRDFILIGHSNGALASVYYAARNEPKPRALVYLDIDPCVPDWQVDYFQQRARSVSGLFQSADQILEGMRGIDPTVPDEVFLPFVRETLRETPEGWRFAFDPETYGSWRPGDLRGELKNIPCPTLVIRAAQTVVMSPSAPEQMVRLIPNARSVEIKDAGHFLVLGKAGEVAREIQNFLDENGL